MNSVRHLPEGPATSSYDLPPTGGTSRLVPAVTALMREMCLIRYAPGEQGATKCRRSGTITVSRSRLRAIAAELEREKRTAPGLPFWLLTIRQGLLIDEALIAWCDEAHDVLRGLQCTPALRGRTSIAPPEGTAGS